MSLAFCSSALGATSIESFTASPSSTVASGHPDWSVSFSLASSASSQAAKEVTYNAPEGAGLVPASVPQCTNEEFALTECHADSQVGLVTVRARYEGKSEYVLGTAPVFDLEPSGTFGRLAFTIPILNAPVVAALSLREASDYGLRLALEELPQPAPIAGMNLILWGVPANPFNNPARFPMGSSGHPAGCPELEDASCTTGTTSAAPEIPFTLSPTTCGVYLAATLDVKTYQDPATITEAKAEYPQMVDCRQLAFNPSLYAAPTTTDAYSPTGLDLGFTDPQQLSPTVPGPSELSGVLLSLPEQMSINPKLEEPVTCSETQAALGSEEPATCPEEAELGTARVEVANVAVPLVGGIYYLGVVESEEEVLLLLNVRGGGVELKLPMSLGEDPKTGQLTLALVQPQLPISDYTLHFFGGGGALLRTPLDCGTYPISANFVPWDESLGTQTFDTVLHHRKRAGRYRLPGTCEECQRQAQSGIRTCRRQRADQSHGRHHRRRRGGNPRTGSPARLERSRPTCEQADRQRRWHLHRDDHILHKSWDVNDHRHRPLYQP